jgi:hypothetical protein
MRDVGPRGVELEAAAVERHQALKLLHEMQLSLSPLIEKTGVPGVSMGCIANRRTGQQKALAQPQPSHSKLRYLLRGHGVAINVDRDAREQVALLLLSQLRKLLLQLVILVLHVQPETAPVSLSLLFPLSPLLPHLLQVWSAATPRHR